LRLEVELLFFEEALARERPLRKVDDVLLFECPEERFEEDARADVRFFAEDDRLRDGPAIEDRVLDDVFVPRFLAELVLVVAMSTILPLIECCARNSTFKFLRDTSQTSGTTVRVVCGRTRITVR
jgi:hypothetical protein